MAKRKNVKQHHPDPIEPTVQTESRTAETTSKQNLWLAIAAAVVAAIFVVIYAMRLDKVVGMFQDDAWYALLGKALATGQGYTLINSPTPGILPLYPPAFPFLLSLAFRIAPQFPQNLWLLKSVSIVAMLLAGLACYYYFTKYRNLPKYLALAIAAVVALNPGLVFLATSSLMSECVFTLAQMAALVAVERCVASRDGRDGGWFWLFALLAAAATSWAFLTRSMAAGLILAALIYLLKERLFKSAVVFAAGVALLAGSWTLYSRAKAPTSEQRAEINTYIVRPYTEQFWDRVAGHESAGRITAGDLPARFWNNISSIVSSDLGGIVAPSFFPSLNQGMAERGDLLQLFVSLIVCGLIVTGFVTVVRQRLTYAELALPISLLIIIIWPFPPYRFLVPWLPLLLYYFLTGCKLVFGLHQRSIRKEQIDLWIGVTVMAGLLFALDLYGNISYLDRKNTAVAAQRPRWIRIFDDNEAILKWTAENVPKSDAIASANPALVSLYTGNKTTAFDNPAGNWERWNRLGVRYLVTISPIRMPEPDSIESKFRVIHRAGGELNLRVTDFGPAASRPAWGTTPPTNIRLN